MHAAAVPYTYSGCRRALPCSYSWEYAAATGMDAGSQHADAEACVGCFIHALCDFLNWPSAACTNSCKVFSVQLSVRLCGGGCSPPHPSSFHRCWVVVSRKADEVVWLFQPQHFYLVLNIATGKLHNSQHIAFRFCMVHMQQWNGKLLFIMYITFNVIECKEIFNSMQEYWDFLATKWAGNTRSPLIQAVVKRRML